MNPEKRQSCPCFLAYQGQTFDWIGFGKLQLQKGDSCNLMSTCYQHPRANRFGIRIQPMGVLGRVRGM